MLLRGCRHEISFWVECYIFNSVFCQSLIIIYIIYSEMKLIVDVISLWSFNEIDGHHMKLYFGSYNIT